MNTPNNFRFFQAQSMGKTRFQAFKGRAALAKPRLPKSLVKEEKAKADR